MTKLNQIYRCTVCGNIVEVMHTGAGTLVCCGEPMELLIEKNKDTGYEKHVPVIEKKGKNVLVKVGSIPHPMEEKHYIEWIEIITDGKLQKRFLHPGDKSEAEFCSDAKDITTRIYCNIHGLWKS